MSFILFKYHATKKCVVIYRLL